MRKKYPKRLTSNKKIAIIAPGDPVRGVLPEDKIVAGYCYLKDRGFTIVEGESVRVFKKKHTAGSPQFRAEDFHKFIKDEEVGCIMAFWGGLNSNQLLDRLDYGLIAKNPKIIIGYSDVTALTTAITTKTGLITFSGPALISFAKPEPFDYTWEYFDKMCINPKEKIVVKPSLEYADDLFYLRDDDDYRIKKKNEGVKVFKSSTARGEIIAGNLQTLLLLNGTEYLPDINDKVLFVEEDETSTPAHVDRFLCQCKHLGWFNKIKGIVFGRFTEQSQFSKEDSFEDILREYFSKVSYPVLYNVDFGHSDPIITIPNGGICSIKGDELVFERSVKK